MKRPPGFTIGVLIAALLGSAAPAAAAACDANAIATVRYFLEDREAREYRRAQRYLSEGFGQHFRSAYSAAYIDYMSYPDVTWRQSSIQGSALSGGQCTVSVSAVRYSQTGSGAVAETYTLVATYLGWRIEDWRWQPAP